jgi:hypothetical protein
MSASKENLNEVHLKTDLGHNAIPVTSDIKHHATATNDVCRSVLCFDVEGGLPIRFHDIRMPGSQ